MFKIQTPETLEPISEEGQKSVKDYLFEDTNFQNFYEKKNKGFGSKKIPSDEFVNEILAKNRRHVTR